MLRYGGTLVIIVKDLNLSTEISYVNVGKKSDDKCN